MALHPSRRLQLRMLLPIVAGMLAALVAVSLLLAYVNSEREHTGWMHARLDETRELAGKMFEAGVTDDRQTMQVVLAMLIEDAELARRFKAKDRPALLAHVRPRFFQLQAQIGINQWSFHLPDRVNFLRVHWPIRQGDRMNSLTLREAQRLRQMASGIEMDTMGNLTLKVAMPLHDPDTGALLGYVELGRTLDHIVDRIEASSGMAVHLLLHKAMLDEPRWHANKIAQGLPDTWDRCPEVVDVSARLLMTGWQAVCDDHGALHAPDAPILSVASHRLSPVALPLHDAAGRWVADLVMLSDVTFVSRIAEMTLLIAVGSVLVGGVPVMVFLYRLAAQLQARLDKKQAALEQLAWTDPLTGLETRRRFDERLAEELERSKRHGHEMVLLMVDIDHFKRINDTFGHQAGDAVLRELAARLNAASRETDAVCRFGGEEFMLLLPETGRVGGLGLAERLLASVSDTPFEVADDQVPQCLTVSIGLAVFPQSGHDVRTLVHAADAAMYAAKNAGRNQVLSA